LFPSKYIIGVGSHPIGGGVARLRETRDSGKRRGNDRVLSGKRPVSYEGEKR